MIILYGNALVSVRESLSLLEISLRRIRIQPGEIRCLELLLPVELLRVEV